VKVLSKILFVALLSLNALAEDPPHPRVAELEQYLANQAHNYLSSRFPGMPFLVNVKVDPMFRSERNANGVKGEQLPYFDLSSEEIVDEWDDPARPLSQLQRRVRKTVVTIAVPNQLPETEAVEIRESTVNFLHLNAARDEVYINRKAWRTYNIQWLEVLLIGSGILFFLMGMLWINRISSNKIAKALEESARKSGGGGGGAAVPTTSAGAETKFNRGGGGEFQMHDPVKLKDLAVRTIDTLCAAPGFPSHLDVFELNEIGKRDPAALGAILVEFPQAVQDKLFAYSMEDSWLQALNEPGAMDFESLMVLRKLLRNKHTEEESAWSALLLSTWRLTHQERIDFLQKVSKDEAIAILKVLPKGIALNTARKLFPGGWAQVLEPSAKGVSVNAKRCETLCNIAQSVRPLRTRALLAQYREELELLSHLLTSDPYEEREIYQVLSKESRIPSVRPPFFRLFDQDEETCRAVFSAFAVGLWAKVLADMKPTERQKIEAFLSEKQRFLYNDLIRQVSSETQAQREEIGRIRLQIAAYLNSLLQKKADQENEPVAEIEPLREAA
jgi:hypothetical protein